jgi:hypothetical protein
MKTKILLALVIVLVVVMTFASPVAACNKKSCFVFPPPVPCGGSSSGATLPPCKCTPFYAFNPSMILRKKC